MLQIVLGMDGTSQYFSRFRLKLYKIGKHLNMFAVFFHTSAFRIRSFLDKEPIVFSHPLETPHQHYANDGGYEVHT